LRQSNALSASIKEQDGDGKVIGAGQHFFHIKAMRICSIIALLSVINFAVPATAATKPYRVSLIGDGYDGADWRTGILIELEDGWKTYWRMPGEAGIPPDFTWTSSVPTDISVVFPVPGRYRDASGETVGYKHEVVLPVIVKAGQAANVALRLNLFFAVCKEVCIPAQATAAIDLGSAMHDPDGIARVEVASQAVPVPGIVASAAAIVMESGKPVLRLTLPEKPDDIFVESPSTAYFRTPQFTPDGKQASLIIDNVNDPAKLNGLTLTLTAVTGERGLEQKLTLP
jgi:DsbC/DsbD-like thiol-disulfide interchange protein